MHRGVHESKDNARSVAYTHQVLSNEEQDDEACGEPQGNVHTRFLHSFTHPSTPPPEEAEELPNTQRQASLLDSVQTLFEQKMMMEAVNGEQVTFRRMDEILENVTRALELPLSSPRSCVHSTMLEKCASEWTRGACPSW